MDIRLFEQQSEFEWRLPKTGKMRVPVVVFADKSLLKDMDDKVASQLKNVAGLPGIVKAALGMPDAHSGYGFPIGGVGAFDPDKGGVVSAGGVGFDIACGVRTLLTNLDLEDVLSVQRELADLLFARIPAGLGVDGDIRLKGKDLEAMLRNGARWAVQAGFGEAKDLEHTEENGVMSGAEPKFVSEKAKKRMRKAIGTLGSGNHYLEIQQVAHVFDEQCADAYGLRERQVLISIHCGSRGLGHQIGEDFLARMLKKAPEHGLKLPDKELACAPIHSTIGQEYLGAMRCGINCALANRQVLTHLAREAFAQILPQARLALLYDVSHNTCKQEKHKVNGRERRLFVHRKGATRSFGPGHPDLPASIRAVGQPVLVGGSMGTPSHILAGLESGMERAFGSACHGAGRNLSRSQAKKRFQGRDVVATLENQGVFVRAPNLRGVAEEAPGAYKDVNQVVDVAEAAGLAKKVAQVLPLISIKG